MKVLHAKDITMEFLIAKEIIYSSTRSALIKVGDGEMIHLPPAASFILLSLLKNHGKVVERNTFIESAWNDFGFELSGNTLNQYISLLRKNFLRLGTDSEIITTITRAGFSISEQIDVSFEENEKKISTFSAGKWVLLLAALIVILLEIIFLIPDKISQKKTDLILLGDLDGCDIFSTFNLTTTYGETAKNIAREISSKYLPCRENSVFLFDADGGLVFQKDGRAYLGRCDVSPASQDFAGCQEVVIYETR